MANFGKVLLPHTVKKDWENWIGKEAIFAQSTEGGGGVEQSQRRQQNYIFATYSCSHLFCICTVCVQAGVQAAPVCKQLQNNPPSPTHAHKLTQTLKKSEALFANV